MAAGGHCLVPSILGGASASDTVHQLLEYTPAIAVLSIIGAVRCRSLLQDDRAGCSIRYARMVRQLCLHVFYAVIHPG